MPRPGFAQILIRGFAQIHFRGFASGPMDARERQINDLTGNNFADVAEPVDATDLKSVEGNLVGVRVPPSAPVELRIGGRALKTRYNLNFFGKLVPNSSVSFIIITRHPADASVRQFLALIRR